MGVGGVRGNGNGSTNTTCNKQEETKYNIKSVVRVCLKGVPCTPKSYNSTEDLAGVIVYPANVTNCARLSRNKPCLDKATKLRGNTGNI